VAAGLALTALGLASCERESTEPRAQAYVLVDLSQTWHNDAARARNLDVLTEIGGAIAAIADERDPPVAVQYYAIGEASLEREPLCDALYRPSVVKTAKAAPRYAVRKPRALRDYLTVGCPQKVLTNPPEPRTEITTAVATVSRQPSAERADRFLVIASDFMEDTPASDGEAVDLTGFKVLMVYRPLAEDRLDPRAMSRRVEAWRRKFAGWGAAVEAMPDTALKRSTIETFLWNE
jgi:hypothetical protein